MVVATLRPAVRTRGCGVARGASTVLGTGKMTKTRPSLSAATVPETSPISHSVAPDARMRPISVVPITRPGVKHTLSLPPSLACSTASPYLIAIAEQALTAGPDPARHTPAAYARWDERAVASVPRSIEPSDLMLSGIEDLAPGQVATFCCHDGMSLAVYPRPM